MKQYFHSFGGDHPPYELTWFRPKDESGRLHQVTYFDVRARHTMTILSWVKDSLGLGGYFTERYPVTIAWLCANLRSPNTSSWPDYIKSSPYQQWFTVDCLPMVEEEG